MAARSADGWGLSLSHPLRRFAAPPPRGEELVSSDWPLWEVFVRSKGGLAHRHVGSVHAPDSELALAHARDTYTRRLEGVSIWVVPSNEIVASDLEQLAGGKQDLPPSDLLRHPRRGEAHMSEFSSPAFAGEGNQRSWWRGNWR